MTNSACHVALAQMYSEHGNVEKNLNRCKQMMNEASSKNAGLIIFPELAVSGYCLDKETFYGVSEQASDTSHTIQYFRQLSYDTNMAVVISFPERNGKHLHITCAFIDENHQQLVFYRKSTLWGREQHIFTPGAPNYQPFATRFGKLGMLICYDMEFPEPSRKLAQKGVDLIISPSVWSLEAKRRWEIQLPCRALDNQCFVAGVNTVRDGACGGSQWITPYGEVEQQASLNQDMLLISTYDDTIIHQCREQIPYLKELHQKGVISFHD
ncbi:Predicted amidohydrolase [Alteribacillus persepolensis]|uniref:Predicted amidohydrolase n=1 Tax=Alteribacillus persepolensis TaxID=568899 RepID=A0A1G7Z0H9_9BACI|nr:nitrilase-related carbon-nitrogen hydrolase [Alteribacillus persepolensis]SDH02261.1 Predicted amidohydrolase [Alteribacillus persepolensis]